MRNIYIYCEGYTEEAFVNNLLQEYFISFGICVVPIVCLTSVSRGKKFTGGASNYVRFESELTRICKQHHHESVTMMFDYYGLPEDFPGKGLKESDAYKKVKHIEKEIEQKIGMPNFKAHLSLHEFEALLFSYPDSFLLAEKTMVPAIKKIKAEFSNPELIDNSPESAPSKRIEACYPRYSKKRDGIIVAKDVGIQKMLKECPHFKEWIEQIKKQCCPE